MYVDTQGVIAANYLWLRIFDNLASGAAFAVMAFVLASFLWHQDIGHRALIRYAVMFFGLRTTTHLMQAASLYLARPMALALWLQTLAALMGVVYALAYLSASRDLLITLRTTEEQDLRRKDLALEVEQHRMNVEYMVEQDLVLSRELVTLQKRIKNLQHIRGHG